MFELSAAFDNSNFSKKMINSSTYGMFTYLFFKQIQKYILLKKCSNVSLSHVSCTLKIAGERKFVSILTEQFNILKEKQ